jgi:centromeric protein E
MRGNDADPGMMILCIRDIFDYIASNRKREFELRVSYMEVYNEEINDLLGVGPVSR